MKKQFLDGNSSLDPGNNDRSSFQDLFPDYNPHIDTFNFFPSADVPTQVSLQVHPETTTQISSPTNLVTNTSSVTDVDHSWNGITFAQSGGYYPPDNALAAGANVVIA